MYVVYVVYSCYLVRGDLPFVVHARCCPMWHYIYHMYSLHGYISCICYKINDLLFLDDSLTAGVYIQVSHLSNIPSIIHHLIVSMGGIKIFCQENYSFNTVSPKRKYTLTSKQSTQKPGGLSIWPPSVSSTRLEKRVYFLLEETVESQG